jgi:hypothetical protein
LAVVTIGPAPGRQNEYKSDGIPSKGVIMAGKVERNARWSDEKLQEIRDTAYLDVEEYLFMNFLADGEGRKTMKHVKKQLQLSRKDIKSVIIHLYHLNIIERHLNDDELKTLEPRDAPYIGEWVITGLGWSVLEKETAKRKRRGY